MRRLLILIWLCPALADAPAMAGEPRAPRRPNIVLILADDLGFSDIGPYGGEIRTPALDRLAAEGLRFSQFYNAARCCPTRASLLTGLHPHQAGMPHMVDTRTSYPHDLSDRAVTIAEALGASGYRTAMAGKWHVTPVTGSRHNWPRRRGFERFYGTIHGAGSYFDPPTLIRDDAPIGPPAGPFYYTDAIAEAAVGHLDALGRGPDPFFLYVAFTAPHWPLHARPEDVARQAGAYDRGWDVLRAERRRRQIDLGLIAPGWPLSPRDPAVPAWDAAPDRAWEARRMEVYAAQVERMDRGIGRIVAFLEELGRADDTLILFLADNGGCAEEIRGDWKGRHIHAATREGRLVRVGNDPAVMPGPEETYQSYGLPWANASNTPFRRYKHWVHEGGIATPLIARWPGGIAAAPGSVTPQAGHIIDVMATCLDLAGAAYPATFRGRPITPLEGKSLRPIFEGRVRAGHETLCWEHEGNRAVRRGRWKLVATYRGPWELYDLEADRTELHDLAAAQPGRVAELSAEYDRWASRCGVRPWDEVQPPRPRAAREE